MAASPEVFFTGQTIQSLTKARIVSKYFVAWAKILGKLARQHKEVIQYVDLFAGRGRYEDGSPSTPLLILQHAINTPDLHDVFVSNFNDADPETAAALQNEINSLPCISNLKQQPKVHCSEVDDHITDLYESKRLPATLTFIDPFGYRGLSVRLIQAALKDQGCECIFFFNFNRVNAAIGNDCVEEHVKRLFDAADTGSLREELKGLDAYQREEAVIKKLVEAIRRKHAKHVLQFRFLNDDANRTSHYLIFATKNPLGAKIMKDIMAKESSWTEAGTPGFECSPKQKQASIFDLIDPVAQLADELLKEFAGKNLTVAEIYFNHGLERPQTPGQYKEALKRLEAEDKVTANPPAAARREDTMADHVEIQFPGKEL
jgi:three-Cys-motif partner protein